MKALLPAVGLSMLAAVLFFGTAQAHDPYYYSDPHVEEVPQAYVYDPYYELHLIHYQLYRRTYPPVVYAVVYVRPARIWAATPPVVVVPSREVKVIPRTKTRLR